MTDLALIWPGDDNLKARAGQCYTLSMECVLANSHYGHHLFLVHGLLHPERAEGADDWEEHHPDLPKPPTNPHAWVEIDADDGTACVDPVLRQAWTKAEHERLFGTEIIRRYRADVAVMCAMRNDNYGPWDKRSLAEWEARRAIAEADPRYSMDSAIARHLTRTP